MGMKISKELEKQILSSEGVVIRSHVVSAPVRRGLADAIKEAVSGVFTHRLEIPGWRPARDNQLAEAHWRVKHKLKKADKEIIGMFAFVNKIPKATGKRRVSLEIVLTGRQKEADPLAYAKSLCDALVANGLLIDDSDRWMEWVKPTYSRGKKGSEKTVIVLEEMP